MTAAAARSVGATAEDEAEMKGERVGVRGSWEEESEANFN
jgi:hypothetical protein